MSEVRAGLVGVGFGRHNAMAVARHARGRMVALCDVSEEKMQEVEKELPEPVKHYTDYKEMCRDPEIDLVLIWPPNQLHVPVGLEAVRNGKHVMITKPLADRADTAKELVEAAEAAGVVNMMSLSTRYQANTQYLGRLAQEGRFGEMYYAHASSLRRSGIPFWNTGFIEEGGGAFRDMGVHVLDSAWWIIGMPKPVSVTGVAGAKFGPRGTGYMGYNNPPESYYSKFAADDYGGGFIRFEGGVGMQVESFWASHQPADEIRIEIFGTEGGAKLNPLTMYRTEAGAPQDVSVNLPQGHNVWDAMADHLIECILDGKECEAPLRHGLVVQEMLEGLLRSAEEGKEVRLD